MKKVVIVNAHWSNRGDEAALRPLVNYIMDNYKDIELHIVFKEKEEVTSFPKWDNIVMHSCKFLPSNTFEVLCAVKSNGKINIKKNANLRKMIEILCDADVIIYSPGGSVICNRFWWKKQLEYLVPFMCAKKYRIPMVVASPSIGPFENSMLKKRILKKYLSVPQPLCVRENISRGYLEKLNIEENVITTIDSAFYDDMNETDNAILWDDYSDLKDFMSKYNKVVGMTISDFSWHVAYSKDDCIKENIETTIGKFIDYLAQNNVGVILIPQLFLFQNDKDILRKYMRSNTCILSDEYDTYFQQYIISKLYAVVGMRYHCNIFAAKVGTPFIAISYEEKMQGFMETWELDNYLINISELSEKKLLEKWQELSDSYKTYKEILIQHREQWRRLAGMTMESVGQVIDMRIIEK